MIYFSQIHLANIFQDIIWNGLSTTNLLLDVVKYYRLWCYW